MIDFWLIYALNQSFLFKLFGLTKRNHPYANWYYANNDDYYYESSYLQDLKSVAKSQGYDERDIDNLLHDGFSLEEIEEYIYCMEA